MARRLGGAAHRKPSSAPSMMSGQSSTECCSESPSPTAKSFREHSSFPPTALLPIMHSNSPRRRTQVSGGGRHRHHTMLWQQPLRHPWMRWQASCKSSRLSDVRRLVETFLLKMKRAGEQEAHVGPGGPGAGSFTYLVRRYTQLEPWLCGGRRPQMARDERAREEKTTGREVLRGIQTRRR